MKVKITFDDAVSEFLKEGLIVTSERPDKFTMSTLLEYTCVKHPTHTSRLSYSQFKKGVRCKKCNHDRLRLSYNDVKKYFEDKGCELLSDSYDTVDSHLDYICSCGNKDSITFYRFRMGRRCRECSIKKANHAGIKRRYTDLKVLVENENYKLLTPENEYKNVNTNVKFMCDKGHEYEGTLKNFRQHGRRCPVCRFSKGETFIMNWLNKLYVPSVPQYKRQGLIGVGGKLLKFDFAIIKNKLPVYIIEYDGEFHFKKWHENDTYETTVIHDKLKNDYCLSNNIPLYRIPFWEFENLDYILHQIRNYYLSNKIEQYEIIKKYLVNDQDWTYEKYMEEFKNKYTNNS